MRRGPYPEVGSGHPRGSREEPELPMLGVYIWGWLRFSSRGSHRQCVEGAGGTESCKRSLRHDLPFKTSPV